MSLFTRDKFLTPAEEQDEEAGIRIGDLGRALVIWVSMNEESGGKISVAQAAKGFNTTGDVIREAIENAAWIDYDNSTADPEKQFIEVDGE
jgi:hypothetical protein